MPFGLVNAPATFSRIMRKLLNNAQNLHNYLDDVLAHTIEWSQHILVLRDLFERVRKANLSVRPSKCSIGYFKLSFLGLDVSKHGLQPNQANVEKVLRAPRPETKTQLRSFMGLVGFYRQFIPNFSSISVPLTDLTKKGSPNTIPWDAPQELAFNTLREYVATQPILRLPDYTQPMVLQTDASNEGLGAVLLQTIDGVRYPIAYTSRKLLPREKNYATIEKECLAIVWAMVKLQNYLYGQHFFLEVDHEPLKYLSQSNYSNGRIMRWALAIQPFRFTVKFIRGKDNVGADFMSRHIVD
jgi:hypothetical protein